MTTTTFWVHLALFSLCCYHGLQSADISWMSKKFPCDVTHNDTDIVFDCRSRRLKTIPAGITSNATKLYLGENNIQNISKNSFLNMGNLTLLSLGSVSNGKRLRWDEDAFRSLVNLHELNLTSNSLEKIPRYLPLNLKILELNENKILFVDKKNFSGIENVTNIHMSKNCYYWNPCGKQVIITDESFLALTKLKILHLSHNNLTQVPKGLPKSLETLELGLNGIQYISEDDFHGLTKLQTLKLQGNCPRCETAPYPCVPCPNISLGIHPHAFSSLTQLETLHLAGNSLKTLETSWFQSLRNLKDLFLSFNFLINTIEGEARLFSYIPRLERMDLSYNYGLKAYPDTIKLSKTFSKLACLKTLHLVGLVFKGITKETLSPLSELKNLSALNLGTNFIVTANSTIFSSFSHLKMIYLAENRLYPVSVNNPFPNNNNNKKNLKSDISTLFFTQSPQKDFTYELSHGLVKQECFDAGRVLILSSNNLFFISPEQFVGYGDIACLNLSKNGFSAAPNGTEFQHLPNLTYLDLSYNKIDLAYDHAFSELKKLEVLDLSFNSHYFEAYGVTHNLNFLEHLPVLRVLNLSHNSISVLTTKFMTSKSLNELQFHHNHLGKFWKTSKDSYRIFQNLVNLKILDISKNDIGKIPKEVYHNLPRNLSKLSISYNSLSDFDWNQLKDFNQLEILDLSFNYLSYVAEDISKCTQSLRLLDLGYNKITQLSNGFLNGAISLKTLNLDQNKLSTINQSTFGTDHYLETLFLRRNPFKCTCDIVEFINWMESSNITIPDLITEVTCSMPANRKGNAVILFDINECEDTLWLYILTSTFIYITMLSATTAHIFYWDASYILLYLRAKLKGYRSLASSDCVYDAFVSYDTKDPQVSKWVMEHLCVHLEEDSEGHLPLCLEERDWPPGIPLVDNLTQSIQHSRKALFVLTRAYVKTGAFRLAMYLAHQRLLDENMDVIVLLMLEPVLQNSHFLRLRRRLCGNSVVAWPRTAAAEPWFWQNLRNVIRVDNQLMYNKDYSRYFTNK